MAVLETEEIVTIFNGALGEADWEILSDNDKNSGDPAIAAGMRKLSHAFITKLDIESKKRDKWMNEGTTAEETKCD